MSRLALLSPADLNRLREVASLGFRDAARGLSIMVDKEIRLAWPGVRVVPIEKVPHLIGQPDEVVTAVYLGLSGDIEGHALLILALQAASDLLAMLMGPRADQELDLDLDEVERSALGEVGNITCSSFLNALAEATGLDIRPSPPYLAVDMAGAALDGPLVDLAVQMEEAVIIDTWFTDDERRIGCFFLMLPRMDSLSLIVKRLSMVDG